jgi:hypothetical protein
MYKELELKITDFIEKYSKINEWKHPWYTGFTNSEIYKEYINKQFWKTSDWSN